MLQKLNQFDVPNKQISTKLIGVKVFNFKPFKFILTPWEIPITDTYVKYFCVNK